ncbi:MAG: YdcF family protein [Oscillospiraceae bacterium]|nr:YdcF family protein [Oscillospiraceae bacterium]
MKRNKHNILWAVLILIALYGVCIFALPIFAGIVNIGDVFGMTVSGLLLAALIFRRQLYGVLCKLWRCRMGKVMLWISGVILAMGAGLCIVLSCMMLSAANRKPQTPPTAVIVLGCKVNGTAPSRMLKERINAAYTYLCENPELPVIVSGGQGSDEAISEATCMQQQLIAMGIAPQRIFCEEKSTSTAENIQFSKAILEQQGLQGEYMLVTDGFHQYRAQNLAKQYDMRCGAVSADTVWYLLPTYWVREWFGIFHAWVFGN